MPMNPKKIKKFYKIIFTIIAVIIFKILVENLLFIIGILNLLSIVLNKRSC